jgi:hypothetical protein
MSFVRIISVGSASRAVVLGAAAATIWIIAAASWSRFMDGGSVDNDDMLRLMQVRDLLAGKSWFDLNEPRIDPPHGLDSHWSRLIDGGIAGLVLLFRLFAEAGVAELAARAVWPLLWVVPTFLLVARAARSLAGPSCADAAAVTAALHLALCFPVALLQFSPGRLDHHNVQNLSAVALFATSLALDGSKASGRRLGAAAAIALAIGFETLPFVVAAAAVATLRYILRGTANEIGGFCETLASGVALLFAVQTSSNVRFVPTCDALGVNGVGACVAGGLTILIGTRAGSARSPIGRAALSAAAAAIAALAFFLPEPSCMAGPFGRADAALAKVWHAEINEQRPIRFSLSRQSIFLHVALPTAVAAGLLAASAVMRRSDLGRAATAAFFLCAGSLMAADVLRHAPYPVIMSSVVIGATIPGLLLSGGRASPASPSAIVLSFCLGVPAIGAPLVEKAALAAGHVPQMPYTARSADDCRSGSDLEGLAALPAGLVLAPLELGTAILTATHHSVLSTPYHRTSNTIVAAEAALRGDGRRLLSLVVERAVDYVAVCTTTNHAAGSAAAESAAGLAPDRFVPVVEEGPLRVYRIVPGG